MKEVVIKFEPFCFNQTIFIKDTETNQIIEQDIPQKDLSNFISLIDNECCGIHFFGKKEFAEKIKEECLTKYKVHTNILINQ